MRKGKRKSGGVFIWILLILVLGILLNSKTFWRLYYPFPYREIIFTQAAVNNIDPYLVAAIIKVESNFNPRAESKMGARGLMQIMPETGSWAASQMGLKNFEPDKLFEVETNIQVGCWYLDNLDKEFKGNKILVIAAYNGGRGNVRQWIEDNNWSGELSSLDEIPFPETRQYVKKVLKSYKWYRELYKKES